MKAIAKQQTIITYCLYVLTLLLIIILLGCGKDDDSTENNANNGSTSNDLPQVFEKFSDDVEVFVEGDFVVIRTTDVPDHKSPYFGIGNVNYEENTNPTFMLNPNEIVEQNFVFKIPLHPTEASNKTATSLGSIGVSVNGIVLFNQYAGPNNQPLTDEILSFDQYNGHPQNTGVYHYHIEPLWLTANNGRESLIGFLLDGFPVYGPEENGQVVNNSDLDEYHGHTMATVDYPDGIYHYHVTSEDPYINGGEFYGVPGTVTN